MRPAKLRWTRELVNRFWDGVGQTRLVEMSFSKQGGRSLIIAVDHLLPRDGSILDFGAGDGDLAQFLCERGLRAAAYETSEKRMENLQERLSGYTSFLGIVGEGDEVTFDVVIMAEVIEHIIDEVLEASLQRVSALTKPDGLLIVTTPNREDLGLGMVYCP